MEINSLKLLEQYPEQIVQAMIELMQLKSSSCYITGGTIRDWLLGKNSKDLDITVPSDGFGWATSLAQKLGGKFIPLAEDEDTARVVWQEIFVDFSSFREGTGTIEEDLTKRDFTINSMAVPFPENLTNSLDSQDISEILDPAGGIMDLHDKIIRSTSSSVFISDPLRVLRAFRFMATMGLTIERMTEKLIRRYCNLLFLVAEERVAYELDTIIATPDSINTIEVMHNNGVLQELVPELYQGVGVEQPSSHHLDVFSHGLETLRHMEQVQRKPEKYFPDCGESLHNYLNGNRRIILLKWSALFHDLGKPKTHMIREDRAGRITFYNHDKEGARIFDIIADRFKWGRDDRNFVSQFISVHMWPFHLNNARKNTGLTPKAYMRLVKTVGEEFPGLFILAMADSLAGQGTGKPPGMEEDIARLYFETEETYRQTIKPVLAKRLLTGDDLIEIFGLQPGPEFREIFDNLEDEQVEGKVQDREQALDWVKNYLKSYK
ncbi:HDIG domain-containing metalloprotein [Thermodesulfobacteriota bacterium]